MPNRPLSSVLAVKLRGRRVRVFGDDGRALDRISVIVLDDAGHPAGLRGGVAGQRDQQRRGEKVCPHERQYISAKKVQAKGLTQLIASNLLYSSQVGW